MWRLIFTIMLGLMGCSVMAQEAAPDAERGASPSATDRQKEIRAHLSEVQSLIENHCLDCHSATDPAADLDLSALDLSAEQFGGEKLNTRPWEKMWRRLASRQMPPNNAVRPEEEEYDTAIQAIVELLDIQSAAHPRPGRTGTLRRLTRTEYQNAIRDLLSLEIDASNWLPKDESSHGFDNITVDELSPTLLTRYVTAAEKISRLSVGRYTGVPIGVTIRLPADRTQEEHVEGLPFGTRGGTLFTHQFTQDGEYEIQIRLTRDRDEKIEGLHRKTPIDILLDQKQLHQFVVSPPSGKTDYQRDYSRIDSNLKKRFRVTAGPHQIGVTFPKLFSSLSETKRAPFHASYNRHRHPRRTTALYQVSLVGPFDPKGPGETPSRKIIFGSRPSDESDLEASRESARENLKRLMRSAYRRPVTADDLKVPLEFFERAMKDDGFDAGIESALASILVNPNFLFRIERAPEDAKGSAYAISDLELASRLSFFLWSSVPDDTLLKLAETNQLHQPDVLSKQIERMLADPKSKSLVNNFAAQWLYLVNLKTITPDLRLFPDFDDNLREAFRGETEHLFAEVIREDLNVMKLIQSDHTFLNQRLATHYGIPKIQGSHFRRVQLPSDSRRGGLLRHGSVLTVTAYATRTSPTIRGSWILENIFGTPPPPPPANVPTLKERSTMSASTVRQRLALHRADKNCAACHDLIDPVGFALENFDAVGRWRNFDDSLPIESTGTLPDGTEIDSVADLEAAIMKRPEMFVGTLTEKLMTYALGRGIEPEDGPAIRKIVRTAAAKDFRFSALIEGIVTSQPFLMRSTQ